MTHASVFSGIGGPEVAATMLGWENLFHCEINPFGRKVLDYWYPNAKSYEDITTTDFTEWRGRVNVLTGGFPCQPFSYAGKRGGAQDDRYLWPYMFRCIDQIRPDWVVAENVAGILTMVEQGEVSEVASAPALFDTFDDVRRYQLRETFTLQRICDDLEGHGYAVQPVLVPACGVGAPHRRDRVFIIGHRIASDSDDRADRRTAGAHEGESREERIQERHEVRKPDEPDKVRPKAEGLATDTRSGGQSASEQQGQREREAIQRESREQSQHGACGLGTSHDAPHPDSHRGREVDEHMESELADGAKPVSNGRERNAADTSHPGRPMGGIAESRGQYGCDGSAEYSCRRWIEMSNNPSRATSDERGGSEETERTSDGYEVGSRWAVFPSVSPVHRGNDGLPFDVDRLTISFGKWRTEALKAYGNAIVPQVMYEIFRAIEEVERTCP